MPRRASAAAWSVQLEVGIDGSSRPLGRPEPVCDRMDCFEAALRERAEEYS